jgi:DNA-binding transcriptional LysR family regulator
MDLNRVAIFVRVVDERGFTAAAKVLGLPKSSVSRAVSLLEQDLGVRLLQRSARNVSLTEAGTVFYEGVSQSFTAIQEAAAAVMELEAGLRGPIRITAPADAGVWVLASAVARFGRLHPGVHVDVVLTGRIVDLIEEGFDLALRAGPMRDSSLIARKIGTAATALYASSRYLARHGAPTQLAELAKHRCVLFRATRGRATWTLTGPNGPESVEVSGPLSADDFSFVQRTLQSGAGVGFLPVFIGDREVARGRLSRVLPDHLVPGAPLHLVYPSTQHIPRRVAVLRDFLVERLGRQFTKAPAEPTA